MELCTKNIGYSKEKRCKLRNKEEALQKELQEIYFTKNLTLAHKQSLFRYK